MSYLGALLLVVALYCGVAVAGGASPFSLWAGVGYVALIGAGLCGLFVHRRATKTDDERFLREHKISAE